MQGFIITAVVISSDTLHLLIFTSTSPSLFILSSSLLRAVRRRIAKYTHGWLNSLSSVTMFTAVLRGVGLIFGVGALREGNEEARYEFVTDDGRHNDDGADYDGVLEVNGEHRQQEREKYAGAAKYGLAYQVQVHSSVRALLRKAELEAESVKPFIEIEKELLDPLGARNLVPLRLRLVDEQLRNARAQVLHAAAQADRLREVLEQHPRPGEQGSNEHKHQGGAVFIREQRVDDDTQPEDAEVRHARYNRPLPQHDVVQDR